MNAVIHGRDLWYRDENGAQRMVRIESTDPAELDRVEALYRRLEARSRNGDRAWRANHATFSELDVEPTGVSESVVSSSGGKAFPWEGPRFSFALLLGEGFPWSGPGSLWVTADGGESWRCRCCGHLTELPLVACCLNGECNRTGRDLAVPRPTTFDLKRRVDPKPAEPPKLPPPLRDRAGKVLRGGLAGKR